jgi:hypothetical protein
MSYCHAQSLYNQGSILNGHHRPSYHHSREQIKHNCQVQPSLCGPNVGCISHPFGVGFIGTEVALEQIGSHLGAFLTFRGHGAMTGSSCEEPLLSHETSHPLTRTMKALRMQLGMNPRAPIDTTIGLESRLHVFGKLGI